MKTALPLLASVLALTLSACKGEPQAESTAPADSSEQVEGSTPAAPDTASSTIAPGSNEPAPGDGAPAGTAAATTVPDRFRGTFAPDRKACDKDNKYQPSFQVVNVLADEVRFYENGGKVQKVEVEQDNAAITFLDTYGDQESVQVIYLALNADGTVRYRQGQADPVKTFVRCP